MARNSKIIFIGLCAQIWIVMGINIFDIKNTQENTVDKCIIDILTSKTQFRSIVTFIKNEDISDGLLQQIHSSINVNVGIKDFNVSIDMITEIYLIHVQNVVEFENLIDGLDRDWNRQPEALFIVIVKNMHKSPVAAVFKILWEYHFIHVLIIVNDLHNDASIYTYYPYAEGGCGRDYSSTVKLCDCKSARETDVVGKLREYDKPVLDNCTLNVATRHYPPLVFCDPQPENELTSGVERLLIELTFKTKNITLNYTCLSETEEVGTISDNFEVNGIIEKLYENKVDLLFGGLSLNNRRVNFFDSLCLHLAYEDTYVPVTHTAALIERWKIVYMMFQANVWVLFLVTLVFCAVLLSDLEKLWINQATHGTMIEFLNLFGNATQNISLTLREKPFKNVVIVHWIWFTFLINCFYTTRLTSFTVYRMYKPQLNQYLSLYGYNFSPYIPSDIVSFLKNSGQVPIINEANLEKCLMSSDLALDKVANTENSYTIVMYFEYLWWLRNNADDAERVHLMTESVYNNLYSLFVKRGFPLLEPFNAIMLRLPEHGFVHGAKDFHRLPRKLESGGTKALVKSIADPLKSKDLAIPFSILATGLTFALIAFIIELTYKRRLLKRSNILGPFEYKS